MRLRGRRAIATDTPCIETDLSRYTMATGVLSLEIHSTYSNAISLSQCIDCIQAQAKWTMRRPGIQFAPTCHFETCSGLSSLHRPAGLDLYLGYKFKRHN